jgi:hypothetical protein
LEMLLSGTNLVRRQSPLRDEHVKTGRALQRRAVGDVKETAAVLGGVFAIALSDIQGDRSRCSVQLVLDLTEAPASLQERRKPGDESDRFAIDFSFLMIEPALSRRIPGILL